MRYFLLVATTGAVLSWAGQPAAAGDDAFISEATAQRCGLTRVWVTQAQVNRGQSRLQDVVLCDGTLYAQSNRATLEAIDAETGQKLWSKMVGQPDHPSLPPGAFRDLVATVNGSTLYVLNRYTGDILYQTKVDGAPGGGPALSSKRAYVPMVSGMIMAYRLEPITDAAKEFGKLDPKATDMTEEEKKEAAKKAEEERRENIRIRQDYIPPLACSSGGRALVPPVITTQNRDEEFVTWVTDRGYLYLGRIDRRSEDTFTTKYRLVANGSFSSPPAYLPRDPKQPSDSGVIYGGSSDGNVYAVLERSGELLWKFATSDPVIDSPVVIEDRLFATTELGGMFCLNAKTGKQIWWAPEILHFVALGKQRVYAADKVGRLRILDARNGATLDSLPASGMPIKIGNGQTDRIYLATPKGDYPCLREVEQTNPVAYNAARKAGTERSLEGGAETDVPPRLERCVEGGVSPCGQEDRGQEGRCRRGLWQGDAPRRQGRHPAAGKGKKAAPADDVDFGGTPPPQARPALRLAASPRRRPRKPLPTRARNRPTTTPSEIKARTEITWSITVGRIANPSWESRTG